MGSPDRANFPRTEAAGWPRQPAALNDDLLGEIFLRIASTTDLARASTACVSFRRLITDSSFLRRYRSLHPPLLLGFDAAQAPHPNAPAASALARAYSSFDDYIPGCRWDRWSLSDVRDLVYCQPPGVCGIDFSDFAVCDPLYRNHLLLPPIPGELLASVLQVQERKDAGWVSAFLVPSRYEEDDTSFRVIGVADCETKLVVLVFSSGSGRWTIGTCITWGDLGFNSSQRIISTTYTPDCAYGCFYWYLDETNKLLKLDINQMEFSTIDDLPPPYGSSIVIVEAGEGRLGMFSRPYRGRFVEYYTIMKNEGEDADSWQMVKKIPVPCTSILDYCIIYSASEEYIFLVGRLIISKCFSLEIKTFKVEWVTTIKGTVYCVDPYIGYPPFMSPRMI